jgi:hypothetical protein
MEDFEKLGAFYLGRPYDLSNKKPKDGIILYDSKDLLTHAVCVGMTGSGKTGLCIALLEEAAIDGIPSIVIDPKGDLANLLLTFPDLKPEDFAAWVNEEDARKKNLSVPDYAAQQADAWKKGLAGWGQDGARIARLRQSAEFSIYTPGSNAGLPVSILKSFAATPAAIREDDELLGERVNTTVTSLLGLLGIAADPIKSREHILISNILNKTWSAGGDLDLGALIQQIQSPPMTRKNDSSWRRRSTTCWRPRRSAVGWKESPLTSATFCTRRPASREWRSFRSPISPTPSACSSSLCF